MTSASLGLWILGGTLVLLAGGGVAGTLWATGYFARTAGPNREGQVALPALARPVAAFESITRDDLINPETRQLNVVWLPKEQAGERILRDLGQIVGRVLSRNKGAGYVLTENDFLPPGTRPGITAGVPPGKRSVTISIERVPGLELLRQGDVFDLMAVLPPRETIQPNIEPAALLGGIKPPDTRAGRMARQTGVKPLVIAGSMIAHTQGRSQTTTGAGTLVIPPATSRNAKPAVIQATVAVDPEEVTPLTEALGQDVKLFCVARSGHPQAGEEKAPPFSAAGLVPVLATVRAVPAYSAIGPEDLADEVTGRLNVYYFPQEKIDPAWIAGYSKLVGRVVSRDIAGGALLTEADLLPTGARPGLASAAPAGAVVIVVDPSAIAGLDRLQRGDHFRLLSRLEKSFRPTLPTTDWAALHGGVLSPEDQRVEQELRTGVRTITEEGMFLGQKEGQAAIAVPQGEAIRVSQVLKGDHDLFAIIRGGKEDASFARDPAPDNGASPARSPGPRAGQPTPPGDPYLVAAEVDVDAAELVSVPVLVRPVKAFQELKVEDFVDPATGKLRLVRFPADSPAALAAKEVRDLLGRVLKRSRGAGEAIFSSDLLPAGTRPGVTAGIPPGWTAIRVSSLEVRGLAMASEGDVLDLVAARPIASGTLQQAEIWPARNQEGTFAKAESQDIFLQADVNTLTQGALVLSREAAEIEIEVREKTETATDESELGDVITRKSVSRSERPQVMTRKAVVCTIAVPAEAVTRLTEALAVQSVVTDEDGPQTGDDAGRERGRRGRDGRTLEREVALFAILRSSNPTPPAAPTAIPAKDIIAEWNRRWRDRFVEYLDRASEAAASVQPREHWRGSVRTQEFWRNGQSFPTYPQQSVKDSATGAVLRGTDRPAPGPSLQ